LTSDRRQFRFTERLTRNHERAVLGFVGEAAIDPRTSDASSGNDIHQGAEIPAAHEQTLANKRSFGDEMPGSDEKLDWIVSGLAVNFRPMRAKSGARSLSFQ